MNLQFKKLRGEGSGILVQNDTFETRKSGKTWPRRTLKEQVLILFLCNTNL